MVNQLNKFQPIIAELSKPLRDLLSTKNHWSWSEAQDNAFSALKRSLTTTPTLAHYDARRQTTLSFPLMHHPTGLERFYFKSRMMNSGALLHMLHEP